MNKEQSFSDLVGKTLAKVDGGEKESEQITFYTTDGDIYTMDHRQDCCERVCVEDVCGDWGDIIGYPILLAEESISKENPEGVKPPEYQDSFTWTFYKLATNKGFMTIRWYGNSNGYYSESVDFYLSQKGKV